MLYPNSIVARIFIGIFLILITVDVYSQKKSLIEFKNEEYDVSWVYPKSKTKEVGKHQKLELGIAFLNNVNSQIDQFIKTNKGGLNPFNPEDINIEVIFISPTNIQKTRHAFYYQAYKRNKETWSKQPTKYNWRVRFSPDEVGDWTVLMNVIVKNIIYDGFIDNFKCVPSNQKGILMIKESERYLYLSESKQPFFTVGHNIAHSAYYKLTPQKAEQHKVWLTELAENGGNFFRLEMGAQNALPDWNNYKNYDTKMPQMWEFDDLIEHAKDLGLYFILFRHHTEVDVCRSWDVSKWENNPYRIGFELKNRLAYFTNEEVIKWQKNTLRYIFSRWGYNTSFAFYEYQEIDNWLRELKKETGFKGKEAITVIKNWYVNQKEYIKSELGYDDKLFINTYATTPDFEYKVGNDGMFANSDAIGFHKYGQHKAINYDSRYDKAVILWKIWKKPLFVEEMGVNTGPGNNFLPIYKCSKAAFHNGIWSTSFMGVAGTGMVWWWDRGIHDFEAYKDYNALAAFFKDEKMNTEDYNPQKWHSKISIKRALLENYALTNKDETKVIGWVHNATHYWRNVKTPCMEELINEGKFKTPYKFKDGYTIGGEKKEKTNYNKLSDAYTKQGVQNVADQNFEIKGLKNSKLFGKASWYEINYYSTASNKNVAKQVHKTNIWGKLKPKFPSLNEPDFSYKIIYLGESKKEPQE